jgi:hypothetical protein
MIFVQGAAEVTLDQVISGTTMVPISELGCPVNENDHVNFTFRLLFRQSSALDSIKIDLDYPVSPVEVSWNTKIQNVLPVSNVEAVGTTVPLPDVSYVALIDGILINGDNPGVLQPMCASTGISSAVTIRKHSCVMTTVL